MDHIKLFWAATILLGSAAQLPGQSPVAAGSQPAPKPNVSSTAPANPPVSNNKKEMTSKEVFDAASPAVAHIITDCGSGSGFFISPTTLITNHHVIEGASEITIVMPDKTRHSVKNYFSDPVLDLAVLETTATAAAFLKVAPTDPKVGEKVIAIGYPASLCTMTEGIVNGIRWQGSNGRCYSLAPDGQLYDELEKKAGISPKECRKLIQISAAIDHGSSGGPLLNTAGEVGGINSGAWNREGQDKIADFAVAASYIQHLLTGKTLAPQRRLPDGSLAPMPRARIDFSPVNVLAEVQASSKKALEQLQMGDSVIVSGYVKQIEFSGMRLYVHVANCRILQVIPLSSAGSSTTKPLDTGPLDTQITLSEPGLKQVYESLLAKYKSLDWTSSNPLRSKAAHIEWEDLLNKQLAGIKARPVTWRVRVAALADRSDRIPPLEAAVKAHVKELAEMERSRTRMEHRPGYKQGMFIYPDRNVKVTIPKTESEKAQIAAKKKFIADLSSYLRSTQTNPFVLLSGLDTSSLDKPPSLPQAPDQAQPPLQNQR